MTELGTYLERLGLEQYLDAFIGEGFDTVETLLDIQESDFDSLNVKLGHRRKLQRAIADQRGIPFERVVAAASYEGSVEGQRGSESGQPPSAVSAPGFVGGGETKRKYRRHPKPDENAPERPPSAYVIFSNKIREEVRDQNLTFTQIAKLVGERWQKLDPDGKEPFEAQANSAKEIYNIQLSTYKKTDAYKEYTQYLADFKVKHGGNTPDQKRPRLEPESSGGSLSAKSLDMQPEMLSVAGAGHFRGSSTGSMASSTYPAVLPSPVAVTNPQLPPQLQNTPSFPPRGSGGLPRGGSPSSSQQNREARRRGLLSQQSSVSDDSSVVHSDVDLTGRSASMAHSTPPSTTPPLLPTSSTYFDKIPSQDSFRRFPGTMSQSAAPISNSPHASGIPFGPSFAQTLPSPNPPESWRASTRPLDFRGYNEPQRPIPPPPLLTSGAVSSPISLPPLMGLERLPDVHRTLPLPRSSPTAQQQPGLTQAPPPSLYPFGTGTRSQQGQPVLATTLERSESDAADALAGLAASTATTRPESGRSDARWQPR